MLHADLTKPVPPERVQEAFKKALCDTLVQSPVLSIISRLQRTLDILDIEGLSKLWRAAQLESPLIQSTGQSPSYKQIPPLGASQSEPSMTDWVDFVTNFESVEMKEMDHDQPRTENIRYYLLAYLLSATFKDCSIIVRLELLSPGKENDSDAQVEPVHVIDLDPKSLNRLPHWEELDREIVSSYVPAERKRCIE
jgi:inositol-pentakisphosphate 2-kinase